ncbi:MAG: LysR family transcriptional regulator [Lactobacillaceae bacterium]|nr:LysR family transcriptional regulator [Lactobacillaceae bacterium]
MTFEQLLYVEVLSHSQSLAQAADTLHISKSGLSLAISQLEDELGIKLFERTYNGSQLSQAGQRLIGPSLKILRAKNEMERIAKTLKDPSKTPKISLQYVNSSIAPTFNKYVCQFLSQHDVILKMSCHHANHIIDNVRHEQIDAGLIAINQVDQHHIADLQFAPIIESTFRLIVSPDNALYNVSAVQANQLIKEKFVLFDDPYNQEMFNRLQFICGPLNCILTTDNSTTFINAIRRLNFVGVGRYSQTGSQIYHLNQSFHTKSIDQLIPDKFIFGLLKNPKMTLSPATDEFLTGLIAYGRL